MDSGKERMLDAQRRGRITTKLKFALLREQYYENPLLCKLCQSPIEFEKRLYQTFCSHSCSANFNNPRKKRKRIPKNCLRCGTKNSNTTLKYCSRECALKYKSELLVAEWTLKGNTLNGKRTLCGGVRRWLFARANGKCQKCGWNKLNAKTNKTPLQINHIDGNWSNNSPDNLEVLCPNCHALTENFGALNKGSGRKWRYEKRCHSVNW